MSWFTEELFLIPNWAWFVIIVGIFCILMAIVIVTCVKKSDKQDDNAPEPVLMIEDGGKDSEPQKEEKKEEVKEEKVEEVVYTEPEPVLVEEPVQPIKEEKPAKKSEPKKTTAAKTTKTTTAKTAEKKPAAKTTATKSTAAKTSTAKTTATKSTAAKSTAAKSEKPATKSTTTKTASKPAAAKTATAKKEDDDKVYHISKRKEDKKWQVKAEGSTKALKLFFTQDEAIDYAKSVAGNQEGRIVIHKEDGGFRKLKY